MAHWKVSDDPKRGLGQYGYHIVNPQTKKIVPVAQRRAALRRAVAATPAKRVGIRTISGRGQITLRLNAIRNYRRAKKDRVYRALSDDIRYLQSLAPRSLQTRHKGKWVYCGCSGKSVFVKTASGGKRYLPGTDKKRYLRLACKGKSRCNK